MKPFAVAVKFRKKPSNKHSSLAIFVKLTKNPSLRALAKQSRTEFQLKIDLDCYPSFAKTAFLSTFSKIAKVEKQL